MLKANDQRLELVLGGAVSCSACLSFVISCSHARHLGRRLQPRKRSFVSSETADNTVQVVDMRMSRL